MSWKKHRKPIGWCIAIVLFVWLVVLGISLKVFFCGSDELVAKWGQFGDAFGSVNALFSGLALLGVIAALLLQREDIDLQLEEMRKSAKAQRDAAELQRIQARVSANAEMLRAWPEVEAAMKAEAPGGQAAFDTANQKEQKRIQDQHKEKKQAILSSLSQCLKQLEEWNRAEEQET